MNIMKVENVGPIKEAEVEFGDFTVLVGPQATGKSIFLQLYLLKEDAGNIKYRLNEQGYVVKKDWKKFLSTFLGEGMESIWEENSKIFFNGKEFTVKKFISSRTSYQRNFYIPAQRVMTIKSGWPEPFKQFEPSFPYVLRDFSENIRLMMEEKYSSKSITIFPQSKKLKKDLRNVIQESIYKNSKLILREIGNRKSLVLTIDSGGEISTGSWSAGQREFTPLMLGLYWALPGAGASTKDKIETIIIEELETGLHPKAIIGVILLVMDLLNKYKVILSTHSNTVLDVIWAIQEIKKNKADPGLFLNLFGIKSKRKELMEMAKSCLEKNYKVYYFKPELKSPNSEKYPKTVARDISDLDPGSDNADKSGWGGLSEFSGNVADIVSSIYSETE